ncbi:MAG: hypothetical protein PUQ00_31700 [Nostoc sp. S13]|nr:hypothetical protein [Nostoc sp. S13]
MYLLRVPQQEQMMIDTFGQQYLEYITRSGRVIPKILSTLSRFFSYILLLKMISVKQTRI